MTTKVKGLLKGLRYISQIFEGEKEEEIQIGYPTDVKHVAHIGWDGPSVNTPSWMNQFSGAAKDSPEPVKSAAEDAKLSSEARSSPRMRDKLLKNLAEKQSRQPGSPGSNSPNRDKRRSSKHRKNHKQSSSGDSIGSPTGDSQGSSKPRKHNKSNLGSGPESPAKESTTSKGSRRRRSKGESSGDGSTRPSRSKGANSFDSDPGSGSRHGQTTQ